MVTRENSSQASLFDGQQACKVVIVGEFGVGKTSLLWRYLHKEFCCDDGRVTIVDIEKRRVQFGDKQLELNFWDTAGKEKYHTISPNYYNGAQGIIVVYDIVNPDTFHEVKRYWINEILGIICEVTEYRIPILLVGTKLDLVDTSDGSQVTVRDSDIQSLRAEHECVIGHVQCSAKTGENVDKVFHTLARELFEQRMVNSSRGKNQVIHSSVQDPQPNCGIRKCK